MPADTQDLFIEQGATFSFSVQWLQSDGVTPKNLTGYTARMDVRTAQKAPALVALTSPSGGIVITPATGVITVTITAAQSDAWTVAKALYDLEVVAPDGTVTRLLKGAVTVDPNITQAGTEGSIG